MPGYRLTREAANTHTQCIVTPVLGLKQNLHHYRNHFYKICSYRAFLFSLRLLHAAVKRVQCSSGCSAQPITTSRHTNGNIPSCFPVKLICPGPPLSRSPEVRVKCSSRAAGAAPQSPCSQAAEQRRCQVRLIGGADKGGSVPSELCLQRCLHSQHSICFSASPSHFR